MRADVFIILDLLAEVVFNFELCIRLFEISTYIGKGSVVSSFLKNFRGRKHGHCYEDQNRPLRATVRTSK